MFMVVEVDVCGELAQVKMVSWVAYCLCLASQTSVDSEVEAAVIVPEEGILGELGQVCKVSWGYC